MALTSETGMNPGTLQSRTAGLPVRTLKLEVTSGPDAGKAFTSSESTATVGTAEDNDLRLTDSTVSRYHLELRCQADRILVVDPGSTNGTAAGSALIQRGTVPPGTVLELGRTHLRVSDGETVTLEIHRGEQLGELRGSTPSMRRLMSRIDKVAGTDVPVLLIGESGTGKELIAQAIHEGGPRREKPFITVDCGALSPGLVASELFGHERGAFTGADRRHAGAFERAHGGTVFLDEVGELPAALQTTLLGVLERRRFRRVGGTDEVDTDVRIVSATNRDLRAEVNGGAFRLDLYYRIAVVRLEVPPLRERTDDIPLLIEHFLKEAGSTASISALFPGPTMDSLRAHHWPGNVRELRNVVEALVATGEAPALDPAIGSPAGAKPAGDAEIRAAPLEATYREARRQVLESFEGDYLKKLLERSKGNVSQAARLADMDRSHLIDLLRRHKLR
jgi:DNA-binding NtrC family response regulator